MLVNTKAKVGVFSIALGAYLPQFPQLVPEFEAQYEDFKKTNIPDTVEIIDGGMVTTKEKAQEAGDLFRAADVDLVILQLLTYATSYNMLPAVRDLDVPEISDWLCGQPLLIPLLVFAVVAAYYVYLIKEEWLFRKNTVTRSSIKEGIDKLSSGLCFYVDGGRVVLSNQRMNELCFRLLGRDLQNAALFW